MGRKERLANIYKSIDKSLNKIIDMNAKSYLKHHQNKPWYRIAFKGYRKITLDLLSILNSYAQEYKKAIKSIKLPDKKKVVKDDDGEGDNQDEIIDEILDYEDITDEEIQELLDEIKEKLIEELEEYFEEDLEEDIILAAAKITAKDLGLKFKFNKYNTFTRDYLRDKKIKWAKQVAETTEKRIKEVLVKGFEEGLGSYDIADLIYNDNIFSYRRAEAIARTEIMQSCNYADYAMWELDDNIYAKKWSATGDGKTRESHSIADGQVKKLNEPFVVGGYKMMYPLDGSLGAPAGEIVQCRCTMFTLTKDEYEKEMGIKR